jgi:hypothetical protein
MGKKKTGFSLFNKPFSSDWAFWVYAFFALVYALGSFNDYYSNASLSSLSNAGLVAALIDLVIFPLLGSLIFPTSIILIFRKIARRANIKNEPAEEFEADSDLSKTTFAQFQKIKSRLSEINGRYLVLSAFALTMVLIATQISQNYDLSKLTSNLREALTDSKISAEVEPGTVKRAPVGVTPSETAPQPAPSKSASESATPKPEKTPSATKSATPKVTQTTAPLPAPTPVSSWWPAYFTPWGNTIAYKYSHNNGNCTNTEPSWQCQGSHYIEFTVTEPCSAFSVEITDESGEQYIAYYERYVSTGPIFSDSTGDMTPQSPGRVTKITC